MVFNLSDILVAIFLFGLAYYIYDTTRNRKTGFLVAILGLLGVYLILAGLDLVPAFTF